MSFRRIRTTKSTRQSWTRPLRSRQLQRAIRSLHPKHPSRRLGRMPSKPVSPRRRLPRRPARVPTLSKTSSRATSSLLGRFSAWTCSKISAQRRFRTSGQSICERRIASRRQFLPTHIASFTSAPRSAPYSYSLFLVRVALKCSLSSLLATKRPSPRCSSTRFCHACGCSARSARRGHVLLFSLEGASISVDRPLICALQTHQESARAMLTLTHYTDLADKDLVLMRGEVDLDRMSVFDAQILASQLQLCYLNKDGLFEHVRTFTQNPTQFDFEGFLASLNRLGEEAKREKAQELAAASGNGESK
eukprot:m.48465 g.48465  ORF g.48465 m.48465 type:complete len:305 (-) comp6424_c0_seq1:116-1030(-)